MTLEILTKYRFRCNICTNEALIEAASKPEAETTLTARGWLSSNGAHLCPPHNRFHTPR